MIDYSLSMRISREQYRQSSCLHGAIICGGWFGEEIRKYKQINKQTSKCMSGGGKSDRVG